MPPPETSCPQAGKAPRVYSLIADGRRKVHTTFPDGSEMIEEYDIDNDCLLLRKKRERSSLGAQGSWEYEVGAPPTLPSRYHEDGVVGGNEAGDPPLMTPSTASPFCVMLDSKKAFQWRIRNLPYPASTYSVMVEEAAQVIVVRTTNKKYFKRIAIKTLKDVGLSLESGYLSWSHQHNTLIITYQKPKKVIDYEKVRLEAAKKCNALLN